MHLTKVLSILDGLSSNREFVSVVIQLVGRPVVGEPGGAQSLRLLSSVDFADRWQMSFQLCVLCRLGERPVSFCSYRYYSFDG